MKHMLTFTNKTTV